MYKKYKIALFLCIFILIGLTFENYKIGQELAQSLKKQTLIQKNEKNRLINLNRYGYSDIVEILGNKDNLKIKKIDKDKQNGIALVEVELIGDIYTVEKELKYIRSKENFTKVNNIKIEKDDSTVISRVNMSFINNR